MKYEYNNKVIEYNDFDRNYIIYDKSSRSIKMASNAVIELNTKKKYLEYVLANVQYNNVYYNITKRCNLNCSYCYSIHNKDCVSLDQNNVILTQLKNLKVSSVTLIGGEPFCHPNFYDILDTIKQQIFVKEICIVTNGTLIDEDKLDLFRDSRIYLQISLDGVDEETNAPTRGKNVFDCVYKNIKMLKKEGIRFKVMKVMTRENIDQSISFYDFYRKQDIEVGFFMVKQVDDKLKPTTSQLQQLMEYVYFNEGNVTKVFDIINFADNMMFDQTGFPIAHCGAGINALSINPNGDVFPCVKISIQNNRITNLLKENAIDDMI